jgi:hypothetical protein
LTKRTGNMIEYAWAFSSGHPDPQGVTHDQLVL